MTDILFELFKLDQIREERALTVEELSRYEYLKTFLDRDAQKLWDSDTDDKNRKKELFEMRCKKEGMATIKAEDLLHYGGFDITIGYTDDYFEEFGKVTQLFVNEKDQTVLLVAEKGRIRL